MLNIRFEQAGVIEPMQAAQVASFMNSWRDTFARTENIAGTAGLCPKWTYGDASRTTASQRLLSVGAAKRTHADCHEAAVGHGDRCWPEWRLYEVLRS